MDFNDSNLLMQALNTIDFQFVNIRHSYTGCLRGQQGGAVLSVVGIRERPGGNQGDVSVPDDVTARRRAGDTVMY